DVQRCEAEEESHRTGTEETVRQGPRALPAVPSGERGFDRRRGYLAVQPRRRPDAADGKLVRRVGVLREGRGPLRRTRLPQQRDRALQPCAATGSGPGIDLLQAREDQRDEGLQERCEEELSRVRRPHAEGGADRRSVPRAEGVRRSLPGSG